MTNTAPPEPGLRPNPDVLAKRLDRTSVLVDLATNRIFELNETGTRVWELLCGGLDAQRIAHRLVEEFDVEQVRAANEVSDLIRQLRTEGLLAA